MQRVFPFTETRQKKSQRTGNAVFFLSNQNAARKTSISLSLLAHENVEGAKKRRDSILCITKDEILITRDVKCTFFVLSFCDKISVTPVLFLSSYFQVYSITHTHFSVTQYVVHLTDKESQRWLVVFGDTVSRYYAMWQLLQYSHPQSTYTAVLSQGCFLSKMCRYVCGGCLCFSACPICFISTRTSSCLKMQTLAPPSFWQTQTQILWEVCFKGGYRWNLVYDRISSLLYLTDRRVINAQSSEI